MAAVLAETDGAGDDEKPTWDDDIDVGDIIPPSVDASLASAAKERKKAKKKEKKRKREDDQSAVGVDEMDADAINEDEERWDDQEWDGTEEMRKRVLDQYMEELYGLEFNDMVRPPLRTQPVFLTRTMPMHPGCRDAHAFWLHSSCKDHVRADPLGDPARRRQGLKRVRRLEEARTVSQAERNMGCEAYRAFTRI
jgi:hypothetical protein